MRKRLFLIITSLGVGLGTGTLPGCASTSVTSVSSPPNGETRIDNESIHAEDDRDGSLSTDEIHQHLAIEAPVQFTDEASENVRRITFEQVMRTVSEGVPQVLQADAELRRAAAEVDAEVGRLAPRLAVGGGASGLTGREIGSFGNLQEDNRYGRFEVGVGLFYDINIGQRVASLGAARDSRLAQEHEAKDARLRARRAASQAYFDLVLTYATIDVFEALSAGANRLAEIARSRLESGVGDEAELSRALAARSRANAERTRARSNHERASATLAVLLGLNPETTLAPAEGELAVLNMIDESISSTVERPDVAAARARIEAASSEAASHWWSAFGPEVRAGVEPRLIGVEASDLGTTLSAWAWLGVTVQFGEIGMARVAEADADLRALELEDLERRARAEVHRASSRVRATSEALPEVARSVEALEHVYHVELARYEIGAGTSIEVILAEEEFAEGRLELVRTILRYNDAQMELATAAGLFIGQ